MAVGMLDAEFVHRELLLALWKKTLVEKLKYKTVIISKLAVDVEASVS